MELLENNNMEEKKRIRPTDSETYSQDNKKWSTNDVVNEKIDGKLIATN
ncbi:3511_t:CDS:1, partial [Ambispora leptoticha]